MLLTLLVLQIPESPSSPDQATPKNRDFVCFFQHAVITTAENHCLIPQILPDDRLIQIFSKTHFDLIKKVINQEHITPLVQHATQ